MRITEYLSIAALVCGVEVVGCAQKIAFSKPPQSVIQSQKAALEVQSAPLNRLWERVRAAMDSGDTDRVHRDLAAFKAAGGQVGPDRVELGRFYLKKGDLREAKAVLDPVVDPFNLLGGDVTSPDARQRLRPIGEDDAEALTLWEKAAVNATESEKVAVHARWYAHCGTYGASPTILEDYMLTPQALTEYDAGQWCMGSQRTRAEAIEHYRAAVALAPRSLQAKEQLVAALQFTGRTREAKVIAVQAAKMADDPQVRDGILWGAKVTPDEAARLGLFLPRGRMSPARNVATP